MEFFNIGWLVFVVNTSFPAISFDICELINGESVLFINKGAMKLLGSCNSLLWCLIFDKGVTVCVSLGFKYVYLLTYPSVLPWSLTGMKNPSSLTLPTALSFFTTNLTSFGLLSSGTMGSPSTTTNASKPCSSRTSYCSFKSWYLSAEDA